MREWLLLLLLLFHAPSYGTGLIYEQNTSIRALGMGNAYLGVVKDADALFYNPAGLARISGFNWLILDPHIGTSGYDLYEDLKDIQTDEGFEEAFDALYGKHVWVGAGAKSVITVPYIGFGVYDSLNADLDVNNPVYPELDTSVVNDFGYVAGFGIPILPMLHMGLVAKRIKRTGKRGAYGASYAAKSDQDAIVDEIRTEGTGYGFDMGLNLVIPMAIVEPVFSVVWKDIGQTSFSNESGNSPPLQDQEISLGAAVNIDLALLSITPALDFKHINRSDIQLPKKIHMGVEIGLPLIDIRAGLYQGYLSYGAGLNLGVIRVDAASYGVELGEYPGQREDRRYALQLSFELGFDPNLSFLGGGSGGGGTRSPSKRLKQRR